MSEARSERSARILGLAFDGEDGHIRVTRGEQFQIYLGSESTHDQLRTVCIEIQRRLDEQGRRLEELTREEFVALVQDL